METKHAQGYGAEAKMCDVISRNYKIINVLSRFGIALGFGEKSIREVCRLNGVDCNTFLAVVNLLGGEHSAAQEYSPAELAAYLKNSHAYFLNFKLPAIRVALEKAIGGGSRDITFLILRYFDEYAGQVRKHMEYENDVVFPYLDRLLGKPGVSADLSEAAAQDYSIHIFSEQHDDIETKLSELKDIIIKYYPTHSTNELNSVLFDILMCAQDLESHHFIEDKLFVPAIEKLEQQNKNRTGEREEQEVFSAPDALSEREKEVLVCIVHGMTNKEIATKLYLSTHTVNTHRRNIISKLQIHSPAGLTIYAIVNKLVELEDIKGLI